MWQPISRCCCLLAALWGGLALWYRIEGTRRAKAVWVVGWSGFATAMLVLSVAFSGAFCAVFLSAFAGAFAALLLWWRQLEPTAAADWLDDVAGMTVGEIDGNLVTLRQVRNFDWRTPTDYTARWETRLYDLDRLRSVDMILSYWRGPSIAHLLMSFGFAAPRVGTAASTYVAFSVEVRRKKSQEFSEIGGFFKQFELCIIAADELDVVRLRTHVRGERVYLYRLRLARAIMRALFLSYVSEANQLAIEPRFYNTVTVNCTTLVYQMMSRILGGLPLSHRLLFSGYMPDYVYAVGGFDRRWSLEELRTRGYVSDRARQSTRRDCFSADIRRGIPGIRRP